MLLFFFAFFLASSSSWHWVYNFVVFLLFSAAQKTAKFFKLTKYNSSFHDHRSLKTSIDLNSNEIFFSAPLEKFILSAVIYFFVFAPVSKCFIKFYFFIMTTFHQVHLIFVKSLSSVLISSNSFFKNNNPAHHLLILTHSSCFCTKKQKPL